MSNQLLDELLDRLTPNSDEAVGDWHDVLDRVDRQKSPVRIWASRRPRRFWLLVGAAFVACVFVAPALALLFGLIGRTDIPFTGRQAPLEIRRDFYDLSLGHTGMAPFAAFGWTQKGVQTLPGQARKVDSLTLNGHTDILWVDPTTKGGYCWAFANFLGRCERTGGSPTPSAPGDVNPSVLSLSMPNDEFLHMALVGTILSPNATALVIEYANGDSQRVPFVFVTKPINAGFFAVKVPASHETASTAAEALELLGTSGHLIARVEIPRIGIQPITVPSISHRPLPVVPTVPSAPITRAHGDGVTIEIGANGVVRFDLAAISSRTRALIGQNATYGCFKFMPYWETAPFGGGGGVLMRGPTTDIVTVNIPVIAPPYDGCEIEGTYGHTWPDRNHSHAAVEIALTPRGAQYFADRAAARDLALFLDSKTMQTAIKTTTSTQTAAIIASHYGNKITRLASPTSALPAGRIGYATTATRTTYIEYSTNGKRFYTRTADGNITRTNLDTLAHVR